MSVALFDKIDTHNQLLFSLPFREGANSITQDVARPQHPDVTMVGPPAWTNVASGLGVLDFDGANDYIECAAADTADLNFTTGDYSVVGWINYQPKAQSQIVIGRYGVNLDGWELYLYSLNHTFSLRHHHASLVPTRSGCYSLGWETGTWYMFGISRSGLFPKMYRNGVEVDVVYDPVVGVMDPDTCARDLVVGIRYTKDANWYNGMMWNPRIWDRALSDLEMIELFHREAHWFGVPYR